MHAKKQIYHSTLPAVISMAATSLIFISLLIFTSSTTSSAAPLRPSPSYQIRQACKATRNPQLCESSLGGSPNTNAMEIIQWALSLSSDNLRIARSNVQSILKSITGDPNRTTAVITCLEHLRKSDYRLKSAANALRRKRIKDGRAWTSAVLTHPHGCQSALGYVNDTKLVVDTMSLLDTLIDYISNALSMMMAYDVFGEKTAYWRPPKTERDGFWEGVVASAGGGGKQLGVPAGLKADVTVCKGGGCKYTTLQDAVNAAPNWDRWRQFVILVKAGVYKETVRVGFKKQNVVVLGEGMGKTVITGSLNVGQPGMSTYHSATVAVVGDGFMASNLTIANTAGPGTGQAVAFRSESDQSIIENCELLGNQDTLYLHSLRQYFKSCRIQGNVDFIFGNAATIFEDCTILVGPRQVTPEKGEKNAVTAHARNDPAQTTGFVFHNCLVNGTEEYMKLYQSNPNVHKNYLGRPWREFSRTVFIGCKLEALLSPQGWMPWAGYSALKTLYYGEFNNSGKGSNISGRVEWSNRIPAEHVQAYSITNFIQGHEWRLKY